MIVTPNKVRFGRGQESTEHFFTHCCTEVLKCQGRQGELHNSKKLRNSGALELLFFAELCSRA